MAVADLPTDFGRFKIIAFTNNKDNKEHVILLKGEIGDGENMLLRLHSACLTGDIFASHRCDCGPQLHAALKAIENAGRGMILYHQAEGRGIGLVNKIKAYVLQEKGLDTLDANVALGFKPDERDYAIPAAMLKKIEIKSVRLLTNNPKKVEELELHGVKVSERVPIELPTQKENEKYMQTKQERFGHFLHLPK